MNEANGYEQAQHVDTFIEPQVHPDIDSYMHKKLERATREAVGKIREERLKAAGRPAHGRQVLDEELINLTTINDEEISSPEMQRLRGLWRAAAGGDFSGLNAELDRDIAAVTYAVDMHLNSTEFKDQLDVNVYNMHQANINEWHEGLKETPVDPNTRLGQQIYGTIKNTIDQRDRTAIGRLYKEDLRPLQRAQRAVTTLSHT